MVKLFPVSGCIKVRNLFKLTSGKAHIGTHHANGQIQGTKNQGQQKTPHVFFAILEIILKSPP